jgi:hypothetical protein
MIIYYYVGCEKITFIIKHVLEFLKKRMVIEILLNKKIQTSYMLAGYGHANHAF